MAKRMMEEEELTIEAAAAALNTTPTAILMLLRRGKLIGQALAGAGWRVERSSLEALLFARQKDEPLIACPSSCASKSGGCASCGASAE